MHDGIREETAIVTSEASHYSRYNVAGWLGLGTRKLVTIPTTRDIEMSLKALEAYLRGAFEAGEKVAVIVTAMGSTEAFGIDDLAAIVQLRDQLAVEYELEPGADRSAPPHIHADAVIGWAWAVFRDYDFEQNPLGFRARTARSLHDSVQRIGQFEHAGTDAVQGDGVTTTLFHTPEGDLVRRYRRTAVTAATERVSLQGRPRRPKTLSLPYTPPALDLTQYNAWLDHLGDEALVTVHHLVAVRLLRFTVADRRLADLDAASAQVEEVAALDAIALPAPAELDGVAADMRHCAAREHAVADTFSVNGAGHADRRLREAADVGPGPRRLETLWEPPLRVRERQPAELEVLHAPAGFGVAVEPHELGEHGRHYVGLPHVFS